jgi:asparagine synthetase B (glutamine-hydrolysing)
LRQYVRTYAADRADGARIGVALSGGVDSCAVFAEMLDQRLRPVVVSYSPKTHESTDFKMARAAARKYGLEFREARISMKARTLEAGMRYVIKRGYHGKIEVECLVPMVVVLNVAARHMDILFTGDQADGYFNNSKSSVITLGVRKHTTSDVVDKIRRKYYEKDQACTGALHKLGTELGLENVVFPFRSRRIYNAFQGALWSEVNKPRTKEPIRIAYEEWFDTPDGFPTRPFPVNLHKGDSEFGDTMAAKLLALPKFSAYRSPMGLYNAVARGEV